jgi:alkylhydroperoxidase/carboxymuconolactone decarboxylase family protein YurZ
MDKETHDRGMTMRRKVLGEEYVDRAVKSADDFNRDFQRIVTQYCWGEAWGDDTLSPRERSILNLGMIASLGKMEEFATHVRGALRNGWREAPSRRMAAGSVSLVAVLRDARKSALLRTRFIDVPI